MSEKSMKFARGEEQMRIEINTDYTMLRSFVERLPVAFDSEGVTIYNGRNSVKRFSEGGLCLVVKRFKRYNIFQALAYTLFKPSKALRAYSYAARLNNLGIATPAGVAYIETGRPLLRQGYFVSLCCDDASVKVLLADIDGHRPLTTMERRIIEATGAFIADMHRRGVLFGDLNISNILYREGDDGIARLSVIDTDRARFRHPTIDDCIDDLKRISHRREILIPILRAYALSCGREADDIINRTIRRLERFERRKQVEKRIKSLCTCFTRQALP